MRRTRWCLASLPLSLILTNKELNNTSFDHNFLMIEPVLSPLLTIDLYTLNKIVGLAEIRRVRGTMAQDSQILVDIDCDINIVEPRRPKKIHRLRHDRVKAQHLPYQPGVERACIAVAGDSILGIVKELICQCPCLIDRLVLFVEVMIQVWCCKVWLVSTNFLLAFADSNRGIKFEIVLPNIHNRSDPGSIFVQILFCGIRKELKLIESSVLRIKHRRSKGPLTM